MCLPLNDLSRYAKLDATNTDKYMIRFLRQIRLKAFRTKLMTPIILFYLIKSYKKL